MGIYSLNLGREWGYGVFGFLDDTMSKSKYETENRRHEFLLMEIRLNNEDMKAFIADKYGKRLTSLEHFRTYVQAITAACVCIAGYLKGKH